MVIHSQRKRENQRGRSLRNAAPEETVPPSHLFILPQHRDIHQCLTVRTDYQRYDSDAVHIRPCRMSSTHRRKSTQHKKTEHRVLFDQMLLVSVSNPASSFCQDCTFIVDQFDSSVVSLELPTHSRHLHVAFSSFHLKSSKIT